MVAVKYFLRRGGVNTWSLPRGQCLEKESHLVGRIRSVRLKRKRTTVEKGRMKIVARADFCFKSGVTGPEPVPGQYGVSEIVLRCWICPLLVPDFLPPCLAAGLIGHRASKVDLRPDVGDVPTCEIGELLGTPHRSVSARTDTAPVSLTLLKRAMLEGIHVAWRPALTFQSCHFVSSHVARFIFP
jgi:hypothetical protein